MTCLCTSSVRLSLRVREILGSTPVKGCKYDKLLTFAISSVKNISAVIPSKRTHLSALQWHTWQHKAAAFSMHHTIQPPASHSTSRCKFSTYQYTPFHSIPFQSIPFQPALQQMIVPRLTWISTRFLGRVCSPNSSLRGGWHKPEAPTFAHDIKPRCQEFITFPRGLDE